MKKLLMLLSVAAAAFLSSCIREEAPNAECDILEVDAAWLSANRDIIIGTPQISNYAVAFLVAEGVDCAALEPQFVLTPGATITKNGTSIEGEKTIIHYTAHAEDCVWSKPYEVSFTPRSVLPRDFVFSFENYTLDNSNRYNVWYEVYGNGTQRGIWASGNAGFAFTGKGQKAEDFPSAANPSGVEGDCIKLTTRDTGSFGKLAGMPIAAGNIFIGEFQSANAMKKPLEATRFGLQIVPAKPLYLCGEYKYKAGEKFTDKKFQEVPGCRDTCAIYSVLFEVDPDSVVTLDGSNVKSSERIVLIAQLDNPGEPEEWTSFRIPFEYANGKSFSMERLLNNGYAITVVASSSKGGDFFEGAVGSTLFVDNLRIEWESDVE
ncbi:MAG: PCMD domain-containing protein [Bacteroidaceae bacterium]|nr:PCMD domain-containing protein [Bacteroidaceae bacterium]